MNKEMWQNFLKIVITFIFVLIVLIINFDNERINNILCIIAYIVIGLDIVLKALKNMFKGKVFDENFLMSISTIGALFIGEYLEAVAVMLFYQIGELFQDYAVNKSRGNIAKLMDIRPDYANLVKDNKTIKVTPNDVKIDDIILIKPGEKIPLDGIVTDGESRLNTVALTGESVPKKVIKNNEVLSGCINEESPLKVQVTKKYSKSTVNKILNLVENASNKKSKSENFISKFSKYYTPIVVIIAVLLVIIPTLILNEPFNKWFYRGLSFLVVSCPCALVISIPLSFFGGLGAASKIGVLIKGSNYLEALSRTEIMACDKTGTLTEGVFKVQNVVVKDVDKNYLLNYAAHAEVFSNHPIAKSIKEAYSGKVDEKNVFDVQEFSGKGIKAHVDKKEVLIGNAKLLSEFNIEYEKCKEVGTIIYVAIDKQFIGTIIISDKIKDDSYKAVKKLKNYIKKIVMLTGDREDASKEVAKQLQIDEYYAELLPQDKVKIVEKLLQEKSSSGKLIFVGDGINDAPVLALADIGIAMGGLGSDAAIEAADIVIMNDQLSKITDSIKLAKKTMHIVKENIAVAIAIKIGILILSACGIVTMWAAVFADVGVSLLAILNALRILHIKRGR